MPINLRFTSLYSVRLNAFEMGDIDSALPDEGGICENIWILKELLLNIISWDAIEEELVSV